MKKGGGIGAKKEVSDDGEKQAMDCHLEEGMQRANTNVEGNPQDQ